MYYPGSYAYTGQVYQISRKNAYMQGNGMEYNLQWRIIRGNIKHICISIRAWCDIDKGSNDAAYKKQRDYLFKAYGRIIADVAETAVQS